MHGQCTSPHMTIGECNSQSDSSIDQVPGSAGNNSDRLPWWGGIAQAAERSGVSGRLIEEWINDGLVRSANVKRPGASRGRKLVDLLSLFDFIEKCVNEPPAKLAMNSNAEAEQK